MNGLRVPWAWYTLPFSFPLLYMGVMGSRQITSPTYIRLTMAIHEDLKLTSVPQKIQPSSFPGFDKDTPPTSALKTTPDRPPVNSLASSTSCCTYFPNTNTNSLKPYISPKSKVIHQPSTLDLFLFYNPDCTFLVSPLPTPIHLPLLSLFDPRQWNKYFHIPAHINFPYSENTFHFQ